MEKQGKDVDLRGSQSKIALDWGFTIAGKRDPVGKGSPLPQFLGFPPVDALFLSLARISLISI